MSLMASVAGSSTLMACLVRALTTPQLTQCLPVIIHASEKYLVNLGFIRDVKSVSGVHTTHPLARPNHNVSASWQKTISAQPLDARFGNGQFACLILCLTITDLVTTMSGLLIPAEWNHYGVIYFQAWSFEDKCLPDFLKQCASPYLV